MLVFSPRYKHSFSANPACIYAFTYTLSPIVRFGLAFKVKSDDMP